MIELSADRLPYLPDSTATVLSWDGLNSVLQLKIEKEIGPETGLLKFYGVSLVCLGPSVSVSGIEIVRTLPSRILEAARPFDRKLDSNELVFLVHGSWGEEFFVVAERYDYTLTGKT
jgi:hypothetical protein